MQGTVEVKQKKPVINENRNLKIAVDRMEGQRGCVQMLPELCKVHNIKRRVLYDFVSIMEKFGCCTRVNNERFLWKGLHLAKDAFEKLEVKYQAVCDDTDVRASLCCDTDPSLPHISEVIMSLFCYLKVSTLNIREICQFLTNGGSKYQTMLRKLYTVAARLEVAGLVAKTNNSGEIKLCDNRLGGKKHIRLVDMINTEKELQMESMFTQRRKEYSGGDKSISSSGTSHSTSSGLTPQGSSPDVSG